jgi:hypothetical protein
MDHFTEIWRFLGRLECPRQYQVHGAMQIRGYDRCSRPGRHFREAEKEGDSYDMDRDRRQSHRDEVAG